MSIVNHRIEKNQLLRLISLRFRGLNHDCHKSDLTPSTHSLHGVTSSRTFLEEIILVVVRYIVTRLVGL